MLCLDCEPSFLLLPRFIERIQKKYVYIWAKYSLESKRDSDKRTAFKNKISEYIKIEKLTPDRLQVWFWDESGFSLRVTRKKNWCKKGSRKNIRGDRRKGRVNGCISPLQIHQVES